MCVCLSVRHPGPVYRGVKAAEVLFKAAKETQQRTQRAAEETPQEGTRTDRVETLRFFTSA